MAEQRRNNESGPQVLMIVGAETAETAVWAAQLETLGYRVEHHSEVSTAEKMIVDEPLTVLILQDPAGAESGLIPLRRAARHRNIPILEVIAEGDSPPELTDGSLEADDVVYAARASVELPARVSRLLRRAEHACEAERRSSSGPLSDPRFTSMIVHDLRTPLNVIGLSLRMVSQTVSTGDPDLEEDLRFIDENLKQIERMLAQLSDYCRLFDNDPPLMASEFSPRRLVSDLTDRRASRIGTKVAPVQLRILDSCPDEASLDQQRVVAAIQHGIANAAAAAGDGIITVTLGGAPDRWVTEILINRPAPPSVVSQSLRPRSFERLCGTVADRRGLELAIVARITELFNGSARLEVHEDRSTSIILDWPVRLDPPQSSPQKQSLVKTPGS